MAPKTGKKRHPSGKRPPRDHRAAKSAHPKSGSNAAMTGARNAPKPPPNGFFIWGRHAVLAALANLDRRIATIYVTADANPDLQDAIAALPTDRQQELPEPIITERARLENISPGEDDNKAIHQGMVAAVWPLDPPALEDVLAALGEAPVRLMMLDQLSDPRNVGAIMRSARAFGVHAIITTFRNAPEEGGILARTAVGALEYVPIVRVVNLARAIEALQSADITVAGLAGDGEMGVDALARFQRLAIVMGAEGPGLRRLTKDHCDHLVRIEMDSAADSLNVSNAAAIALYASSLNLFTDS